MKQKHKWFTDLAKRTQKVCERLKLGKHCSIKSAILILCVKYIISIFKIFLFFSIYSFDKCNQSKEKLNQKAPKRTRFKTNLKWLLLEIYLFICICLA